MLKLKISWKIKNQKIYLISAGNFDQNVEKIIGIIIISKICFDQKNRNNLTLCLFNINCIF